MADLIIKPSVGNLILKDDQNVTRVSIAPTTGVTTLSNQVFPAGHVIQMNYTRNTDMTISRTGDKTTPAGTGITCVLPNDLQASSKLFAQVTTQLSEQNGNHWAQQTFITLFCNSVDLAPYDTALNNQGAGLCSSSYPNGATNGQYQSQNVSGQILFTPTGSGAARRTVELGWGTTQNTSYVINLNRANNAGLLYRTGGTTILLMEVAQ